MIKKNIITGSVIFLMLVLGAFVYADSNGVWHSAEDVRPGLFGSDEVTDFNLPPFYQFNYLFVGMMYDLDNTSYYVNPSLDSKFKNVYAENINASNLVVNNISVTNLNVSNILINNTLITTLINNTVNNIYNTIDGGISNCTTQTVSTYVGLICPSGFIGNNMYHDGTVWRYTCCKLN